LYISRTTIVNARCHRAEKAAKAAENAAQLLAAMLARGTTLGTVRGGWELAGTRSAFGRYGSRARRG
jgi:hypothetical protein